MKKLIFIIILFAFFAVWAEEETLDGETNVVSKDSVLVENDINSVIEDETDEEFEEEEYIIPQDTIVVGDTAFVVGKVEKYSGEPRKSRRQKRNERRKIVRCEERMRNGMNAFEKGRFGQAVSYLSVVRNSCAGQMDAPDSIYFFLGMSYMKGKKFDDARMEFRTIIEEFPHSEFIERTYFLVAYSSFRAAPIIQRDNRLLRRAEREFSSFISAYPNSEWTDSARMFIDTITDKLLEKDIQTAEFYEIIRKFESAVIYYEVMLQDFVGHRQIPEIRLRLARNLIRAQRFAEAEAQFAILENEHLFQSEIEQLRRRQDSKKRRR